MINFSTISERSILRRIFYLFIKLIPRNTVVWILQGKLKGKKWIVGTSTHGCWLGCHAYEAQLLFSKTIRKGTVVYDVGANVGFYTLLASILVGPKGRVFAFEPLPENIYYLKRHLQLNHCDNVTVIEAAGGKENGVSFFKEGIIPASSHLATKGSFKVRVISLDNAVLINKIPLPDYIKINAEGSEFLVLLGAKEILTNHNPVIFLSIHNTELYRQCYTFLKSMDYELQSLDEKQDKNKIELFKFLLFRKR